MKATKGLKNCALKQDLKQQMSLSFHSHANLPLQVVDTFTESISGGNSFVSRVRSHPVSSSFNSESNLDSGRVHSLLYVTWRKKLVKWHEGPDYCRPFYLRNRYYSFFAQTLGTKLIYSWYIFLLMKYWIRDIRYAQMFKGGGKIGLS